MRSTDVQVMRLKTTGWYHVFPLISSLFYEFLCFRRAESTLKDDIHALTAISKETEMTKMILEREALKKSGVKYCHSNVDSGKGSLDTLSNLRSLKKS